MTCETLSVTTKDDDSNPGSVTTKVKVNKPKMFWPGVAMYLTVHVLPVALTRLALRTMAVGF